MCGKVGKSASVGGAPADGKRFQAIDVKGSIRKIWWNAVKYIIKPS